MNNALENIKTQVYKCFKDDKTTMALCSADNLPDKLLEKYDVSTATFDKLKKETNTSKRFAVLAKEEYLKTPGFNLIMFTNREELVKFLLKVSPSIKEYETFDVSRMGLNGSSWVIDPKSPQIISIGLTTSVNLNNIAMNDILKKGLLDEVIYKSKDKTLVLDSYNSGALKALAYLHKEDLTPDRLSKNVMSMNPQEVSRTGKYRWILGGKYVIINIPNKYKYHSKTYGIINDQKLHDKLVKTANRHAKFVPKNTKSTLKLRNMKKGLVPATLLINLARYCAESVVDIVELRTRYGIGIMPTSQDEALKVLPDRYKLYVTVRDNSKLITKNMINSTNKLIEDLKLYDLSKTYTTGRYSCEDDRVKRIARMKEIIKVMGWKKSMIIKEPE